jgi:esterase/lipase superfamily enzyme
MPGLVLAAPDIGTKEFIDDFRTKLLQRTRTLTVYCADDLALYLSSRARKSDERLGYCKQPKQLMSGIDMVAVTGPSLDIANHSYYLISPDMLNDIRRSLDQQGAFAGGNRELKLNK